MEDLKRFFFRTWSPLESVRDAIADWPLPDANNEAEFEESLASFLSARFDYLEIRRQFPFGRIRADIVVEQTVAIELKFHLNLTTEFQRLIGQLDTYSEWGLRLIVLVVGDIQDDFKRRIEMRLKKDWDDGDSACFIHRRAQDTT